MTCIESLYRNKYNGTKFLAKKIDYIIHILFTFYNFLQFKNILLFTKYSFIYKKEINSNKQK